MLPSLPGDLKTRKSTGTGSQIEIHFWVETTKFLVKYNLRGFKIYGGLTVSLLKMITNFQQVS